LQRVVEEIASRCKTAWEMSQELRPRWDGVVLLDEKMCPVRGKGQWFYLAVDTTGDIMHCRPVPELSSTEATTFFKEVQALPVKIKGVVTDLDTSLTRAVAVLCAETPHQYCIKHALAAIGILIGYVESNGYRAAKTHSILEDEAKQLPVGKATGEIFATQIAITEQNQTCDGSTQAAMIAELFEVCRSILAADCEP
jgi:transposase-like protein